MDLIKIASIIFVVLLLVNLVLLAIGKIPFLLFLAGLFVAMLFIQILKKIKIR